MIPSLQDHPEHEDSATRRPCPFTATSEDRALVLIVEDDPPMARMIAATLSRLYRTLIACDGQEGLEQAMAFHPNLILCDVSMPHISGEELVKALRKLSSFNDVPIVVLSGNTDQQLHIQLLRAGAQDYLEKPFNREELLVRVANLLMMQQVRRVLEQEVTQQSQNLTDLVNEVVTRKRESEQLLLALNESEINFRFLTDSMPQIVWTARADGKVDYYNQRWFEYTGLMLNNPQRWESAIHPDDLQRCREGWKQAIQQGGTFEIKYRFKCASEGAYRWHLGRAVPVHDANGETLKWFGTSTDIDSQIRTEEALRQSEACLQKTLRCSEANAAQLERTKTQLRAIIDASQEAMLFLLPNGQPQKINACFTDFFGLNDTTVLSKSGTELMTGLKELFEPSNSLDRSLDWNSADQEHQMRDRQVQVKPVHREFDFSSLPVVNIEHASYIGRLYVWHDVTQEREVDRMKSEFVSMASHELRTPLTSIKGYLDLILLNESIGELSEMQRKFLGIIQNNTYRLIHITEDLLDLSRLESGKIQLQREILNINALIRELVPSFQPGLDAMHQTFTWCLPEKAPLVLGDANRVTQILSNLLSNAHKYTLEGGQITLSVETMETFAWIAVSDTGIGLFAKEQAHLFTRFYRARNTLTEAGGGTGLGLVITRSLVEAQGGTIEVESEPGKGSTFRFSLPLA